MEQGQVCQFYIILGEKEFRPPNDGNVYINATGVMDNRLIWESISRAFGKKNSERVAVASKIIFLVPDMSFFDRCNEIMNTLRIKGEVQVLPKKQEVVIPDEVVSFVPKEEVEQQVVEENTSKVEKVVNKSADIVDIQEYQKRLNQRSIDSNTGVVESKKDKFNYSYRPDVNIYHGEVDIPVNGRDNVKSGMEEQMKNTKVSGKTLVKKRTNSAAFISLPVIIFMLSSLLLIASIVLLFVVE